MKNIKFGNKVISEKNKPFIIAEAGVNYYDIARKENIELIKAAKLMIEEAARAGADAIKFQIYKAEKLASKDSPAYWDTKKEKVESQYELFKKYDKFNEAEYKELAKFAAQKKIIFMSTPFDNESVEIVDRLSPVFKIASADITNFPFLRYIAQKRKPIFLSTGASTIKEIRAAVSLIEKEGNNQIVLLHCILNYPTDYKNANLRMINCLQKEFTNCLIGYSDHTLPDKNMMVLTTAFLFGARVIEKHFTLDKSLSGNDHYHAMDPQDLKVFVKNINLIQKISGKEKKQPLKSELKSIKYARRSIVAKLAIPKGTKISLNMLTYKRPGVGISPQCLDKIIGKRTKRRIGKDKIILWDDLSKKSE